MTRRNILGHGNDCQCSFYCANHALAVACDAFWRTARSTWPWPTLLRWFGRRWKS